MAERTSTYPNVTRRQLQNIQRMLSAADIKIYAAPLPSIHSQEFDAGTFHTNGYDISYSFLPSDLAGSVGILIIKVSGSFLFIGMAVSKIDKYIQPYLTKV